MGCIWSYSSFRCTSSSVVTMPPTRRTNRVSTAPFSNPLYSYWRFFSSSQSLWSAQDPTEVFIITDRKNQHWTTIVYRAFVAFVALQHGVEAEAFFNDHTQLTEGIQNGFMALAILIGDSLIVSVFMFLSNFQSVSSPRRSTACGSFREAS
jgi:hypothetical protein